MVWSGDVHFPYEGAGSFQVRAYRNYGIRAYMKLTSMRSILVGFLYWNYFATVMTDPGHPPNDWVRIGNELMIVLF